MAVGGQHEVKCTDPGTTSRFRLTVEPILFCYTFGSALSFPTLSALIYRKVCLSHYDDTICQDLQNDDHKKEEEIVQSATAFWFLIIHLSFEIPSVLLSFFYGALGDDVSRKLTILLPAAGAAVSTINSLVQAIYVEFPVGYLLIGTIINGLFGGWVTCNMASFSYLSDVTTEKSRTFRIAVAESCVCAGIAVAFLVSGFALDHTSFQFAVALCLGMYSLAALYTFFWIKDTPASKKPGEISSGVICKTLCTPKAVKDMVRCVIRERTRNARYHMGMSFVILVTGVVGSIGGIILSYLYLCKQPLSWSPTLYGIFVFYALTITAIGQVVIIPFFRNRLRMRETTILLCAIVSAAMGMALFAFCVNTWMVFLVPLVAIVGISILVILKSLLSKLVDKNELGRIFAAYGALQSVSALIASVLYNGVYSLTVHIWPGMAMLMGPCILVVPFILTVMLGRDMSRQGWDEHETTQHVVCGKEEELAGLHMGPRNKAFRWLGHRAMLMGPCILVVPFILTVMLGRDMSRQGWDEHETTQHVVCGKDEELAGLMEEGTCFQEVDDIR